MPSLAGSDTWRNFRRSAATSLGEFCPIWKCNDKKFTKITQRAKGKDERRG